MFQVGSIFCSRLELLSRTAAGNRAYVSGRHNTTSRKIHTWFLFISQRTLRETSRIFAWKFASNFHVDRIVARKFAAYYRKPRTISRKFARIKTIDVAKSQREIANCRRDFFSSEISSKSHEKRKFCWSSFALLFHNTVDNHNQCFVNGSLSNSQILTCGIPQGTILGPLLFILYINDLPNCLSNSVARMYADDTHLTFASNNIETINDVMNYDLSNVN